MNTALGRFRVVAFFEGMSYVLLMFVAMPLKYMAGMPMAVKIVGWAHGVLFMLYVALMVHAWVERKWSVTFGAAAFIASLIPFGTFVLEWKLREQERQNPARSAGS